MNDKFAAEVAEGQVANGGVTLTTCFLTQVDNDIPSEQAKNKTKAWDAVASKLHQVPGFGRGGADGKKASSHYYQLLRIHRKFQESLK